MLNCLPPLSRQACNLSSKPKCPAWGLKVAPTLRQPGTTSAQLQPRCRELVHNIEIVGMQRPGISTWHESFVS